MNARDQETLLAAIGIASLNPDDAPVAERLKEYLRRHQVVDKWVATYRIDTGSSFGDFSIELSIEKIADYWAVAQAMFPHAHLTDMQEVRM